MYFVDCEDEDLSCRTGTHLPWKTYGWFANTVIKDMIMQIMINLLQILMWPINHTTCPCSKIWSHLDQWTQSYWPSKLENFLLCYMGKWAGGHYFAHHHGCRNIYVWRFSKLWTAVTLAFIGLLAWNSQRPFKTWLSTLCKNVVKKYVNLNFWWRHCKTRTDKIEHEEIGTCAGIEISQDVENTD